MTGIRCMMMRGGTSKGAYFLASDLPADPRERDDLLLRIMGSPDPRQIDGIGGGHPLTSKVAIVSPGDGVSADVDYLFLQVGVDAPTVSDAQTCGNLLAGIAGFAADRGLVLAGAPARIRMVNTGEIATCSPGTDPSEVLLGFTSSRPLLPTGNVRNKFDGIFVTCVDAGMPMVVVEAAAFGLTGHEPICDLEADTGLLTVVTALRLAAGHAMGLGDVSATTVPKICLIGSPHAGGTVSTRTFIPVRVHEAIGVLGGLSVAAALLIDGAVGHRSDITGPRLLIEHPTGIMPVEAEVDMSACPPVLVRSAVVRTARKLFDGTVFPRRLQVSRPPLHDIAHLSYAELLTPEPERSLWFFTEVLGLTENGSKGDSVYLRTWDEYEQFTLKLTAHSTSGIRATGLRAESRGALERRAKIIETAGLGLGWQDGEPGLGPTYAFSDPDGHPMHAYYDSDWYIPPEDLVPALKNQAQRYPRTGFSVRRLDHVNYLAESVLPNGEFVRDVLGGRVTEEIQLNDGSISAQWLHFATKSYDLVYTRDWTGSRGRLHHIAFATDTREDILRAADICLDAGVFIETGPHKHAIQQTFFLYVYEPGGNRIELCNPVARLVLAPDWKTVTWTEAERAKGQAWGLKTIESFHTHGTPPVP